MRFVEASIEHTGLKYVRPCTYLIWDTLEEIEDSERVEYFLSLSKVRNHVFVFLGSFGEKILKLSALERLLPLVLR